MMTCEDRVIETYKSEQFKLCVEHQHGNEKIKLTMDEDTYGNLYEHFQLERLTETVEQWVKENGETLDRVEHMFASTHPDYVADYWFEQEFDGYPKKIIINPDIKNMISLSYKQWLEE